MPREGRWEVHDGTASEIEMTDFLYGLVRMLKPKLIVETGTYRGASIHLGLGVAVPADHFRMLRGRPAIHIAKKIIEFFFR